MSISALIELAKIELAKLQAIDTAIEKTQRELEALLVKK